MVIKMTLKEILSEPEPTRKEMKCGTCFYYRDEVCKRYPPQATIHFGGDWDYPFVKPDMWCGEWIEKK